MLTISEKAFFHGDFRARQVLTVLREAVIYKVLKPMLSSNPRVGLPSLAPAAPKVECKGTIGAVPYVTAAGFLTMATGQTFDVAPDPGLER